MVPARSAGEISEALLYILGPTNTLVLSLSYWGDK